MASILSHPAVPLALMPLIWSLPNRGALIATGIALSILPDADVIGFGFDVPYESFFGHRGFSHSLTFAAIAALIALVFVTPRELTRGQRLLSFVYLFVACASHGLLDALTNGGLGVAILSPVDNRRIFFPATPIEVSPIGISAFFSEWGATVLKSEVKWIWAPALAVALVGVAIRYGVLHAPNSKPRSVDPTDPS